MSMFEVWLLLVLIPKLPFLFAPIAIISAISCVIGVVWWLTNYKILIDEKQVELYRESKVWGKHDDIKQEGALRVMKNCKKLFKWGVISLCISSLLIAAIPSRKEMAAIVLIPYVSNNPEFQKLPENIVGMLNDLLKEYRKELSPAKKSNSSGAPTI